MTTGCCSVCCSVLQCVAVCCSVLQCVVSLTSCRSRLSVELCVAACCSVLQCVAVRCNVLQCVAVCVVVSSSARWPMGKQKFLQVSSLPIILYETYYRADF